MVKWLFLGILVFIFVFFAYHVYKYRNPYKTYMYFGKKGAGKSCTICKLAMQYKKRGWNVFTTVPVPGCYGFDPKQIGELMFPPESAIFIDEIGMIFDNRNFKSFRDDTRDWFKLQRHYHCTVHMFSQSYDIDKKIRDLTDFCYLVTNWFNCITVCRKISRRLTIVHADTGGTGESHLADDMDFTPWFTIPFGGAVFTWIPHWTKYFNSFDAPELPSKNFIYYDERTDLYHVTLLNRLFNIIKHRFSRSGNSETSDIDIPFPDVKEDQETQFEELEDYFNDI